MEGLEMPKARLMALSPTCPSPYNGCTGVGGRIDGGVCEGAEPDDRGLRAVAAGG